MLKRSIFLALPALLMMTGCLEFERQTMSVRHDSASDTLYIFQDYQGIFGGDDPAKLSDEEMDQLASVMRGERTFFFNNWIAEYNRERLFEVLREPLEGDESSKATFRALAQIAIDNIKVENVGFYLNDQKRLCGAQRVTIRNVSKLMAALNKALSATARDEANEEETSPENKKLLTQFADSGQATLRLEGNRLEARWPVSAKDYREAQEDNQLKALLAAGAQIEHKDNLVRVTIGNKDGKSLSVTMPFSENPYKPNALEPAKKHGIKPSFDPVKAAEAFLSGTGK